MVTKRNVLIAYFIFLAGYSVWKYLAAAPPAFSSGYLISVAVLVVLTGVLPFIAARLASKRAGHFSGFLIALLTGVVTCVAGYAAFWALFIAPNDADVPMLAVATRGIGWGLLQGGLASLIRREERAAAG